MLGDGDGVIGIELEVGRTADARRRDLSVGLVLRSVGYRGTELIGVPFDAEAATIPTVEGGRVVRNGLPSVGEYAAGWARRGPTGVIGTNRPDGDLVAQSIVADADALRHRRSTSPDGLPALLEARGVSIVDLDAWAAIDRAEISKGLSQGRPRAKLARYDELRAAAFADL
jgi:ferredoxin--NADP+ reductase